MSQATDAMRFPADRPRTGLFSGGSLRIARIGGIDISIHVSWLIIFGLVTWSLATGYFPPLVPDLSASTYWLLGAVSAVLLFVSVLLHELAHSFVARSRGIDVHGITLFLFGGVSNLGAEAKEPSTEFSVAIVGPLTSFAIGALSFAILALFDVGRLTEATLGYLAFVNIALGVFNLIPGFPLDGGRVLRSILWKRTRSLRRATEISVAISRVFGYGFMLWGLLRVLSGDIFGGIWTAAIGWFLDSAAGSSLNQVIFEQRISRVRVADVFRSDPTAAPASITVDRFIEEYLLPGNRRAVPVVGDGRVLGIATIGDIKDVPPARRSFVRVGELLQGQNVMCVRPQDSLQQAVEALGSGDYETVPVVEDGRLLGVLSRADVMRQIEIREALGMGDQAGRAGTGREPTGTATAA